MQTNLAELRQVSVVPVGSGFLFDPYLNGVISHLGSDFADWFSLERLESQEVSGQRFLLSGVLRFGVRNDAILNRLGGEEKVESSLSDLFFLLALQRAGQANYLMDNGFANIFFLRDREGVLRVVNLCRRYCGGWVLWAVPLDSPCRWEGSDRVFYPFPIPSFATRLYPFSV